MVVFLFTLSEVLNGERQFSQSGFFVRPAYAVVVFSANDSETYVVNAISLRTCTFSTEIMKYLVRIMRLSDPLQKSNNLTLRYHISASSEQLGLSRKAKAFLCSLIIELHTTIM